VDTRESVAALPQRAGLLLVELIGLRNRVLEVGVRFEVVLVGVVPGPERYWERPDDALVVGVISAVLELVNEREIDVIPPPDVWLFGSKRG
jgi:hypothetical protein